MTGILAMILRILLIINDNNNKLINVAIETFFIDLCNKNKKIGIKNNT